MRSSPSMLRTRYAIALALVCFFRGANAQVVNESDGIAILEAESFNANLSPRLVPEHSWTAGTAVAGFSGASYMEAAPNDAIAGTASSSSPELQFTVNFNLTGTHYVWIRGHGSTTDDDSVFAGIDGAGGVPITLTQVGAWQWSNTVHPATATPTPATVAVGTTGNHTLNLWMREDGVRIDRIILTNNPNFAPRVGNAWHIPSKADPGGLASMRLPFTVTPGTAVTIYSGNQFQSTGEAGNQLQNGSTVYYKKSTAATWSSAAMAFNLQSGNNKYFSAVIPAGAYAAGDTVQYYVRAAYGDHLATFIYGNDAASSTTELETVARANPFTFTVQDLTFWQSQNIYQILTDRFFDGDTSNNNADANYSATASKSVHGGDFKGLEKKLDYIKSLGATAIWISPVVLNTEGQYHGYSGRDFYAVDPHWGTMADLQQVVQAAHAKGLLVIDDVVVNHGGNLVDSGDSGFPTFKAAGYNLRFRNNSKKYPVPFDLNATNTTLSSLFHNFGNIQNFGDTNQVEKGELSTLDDFKTESAYVRTSMAAIYKFWIEQAGFDGFRIDTVKHVDHGFWDAWSPEVHQHAATLGKPNFFMFGEALDGSEAKVGSYTGTKNGGAFELDSSLDYPLYFKVASVFATVTGNTKQLEDHYNAIAANYDPAAQMRLVTFLDNHDQRRFLNSSNANNNTARLNLALTWLYTARGIPCLYYGTEQAFNGGSDPNNREDMFAGGFEQGPSAGDNFNMVHPQFQLVARLNNYRRLYPALRTGTHINQWNDPNAPGLFAYARRLGSQEIDVVLNTASSTQALPSRSTIYPAGTVLVNLLNPAETLTVTSGPQLPAITTPASSAKMFVAQSMVLPLDPVVTNITPAHDASNVAIHAPVVITFSQPMNRSDVEPAFSTVPATSGQFAWSPSHNAVTYTPGGSGWTGSTLTKVMIGPGATDEVAGKHLLATFEARFTTAASNLSDTIPPTVTLTSPSKGATVSGILSIAGTAADNQSVGSVQVQLDGGNWVTATGGNNWGMQLSSGNFVNGSHLISVRSIDASGNISQVVSASLRFFNVPGSYVQRISAGNPADATDCSSAVWLKDQPYTLGSFGFVGGTAANSANPIGGICMEAQPLYQRERSTPVSSSFRYLFDCPPGIYQTTVLEAETSATGANQRLFNVVAEGEQVLSSFDIFAQAGGANVALSRSFTSSVADAQLEIQFNPLVGDARVSGIEVRKIGDLVTGSDGIPDWWRLGYFDHADGEEADRSRAADDADGDGATNLNELLAGTSPTDPQSWFHISAIVVDGADVRVSWPTVSGRTYQLEGRSIVDDQAPWGTVGDPVVGNGSTANVADPGASTGAPRLYRVRIP